MGKAGELEKPLGMRQLLKLNELMDMSPQSKNLFKIQIFNGDKFKILSVGKIPIQYLCEQHVGFVYSLSPFHKKQLMHRPPRLPGSG